MGSLPPSQDEDDETLKSVLNATERSRLSAVMSIFNCVNVAPAPGVMVCALAAVGARLMFTTGIVLPAKLRVTAASSVKVMAPVCDQVVPASRVIAPATASAPVPDIVHAPDGPVALRLKQVDAASISSAVTPAARVTASAASGIPALQLLTFDQSASSVWLKTVAIYFT